MSVSYLRAYSYPEKEPSVPLLILFDGDFITMISEISGSHGCEHEHYTFLGCSAV
jgi:hypothetical protein